MPTKAIVTSCGRCGKDVQIKSYKRTEQGTEVYTFTPCPCWANNPTFIQVEETTEPPSPIVWENEECQQEKK